MEDVYFVTLQGWWSYNVTDVRATNYCNSIKEIRVLLGLHIQKQRTQKNVIYGRTFLRRVLIRQVRTPVCVINYCYLLFSQSLTEYKEMGKCADHCITT